ncbi:hypothetical protein CB0940_04530 [Cercospora beticola]|uniref:DUF7918 domain-containing protein n=1 Tax=Cercospora beticola TaxID=122368 RepID=A0A2G5HKZ7_CERBT|nr:hypothetical protein CB0940_04530 [Cercospora beticola]PIA93241.1 hypothetical protein CB0940_04530 [Cercospora beticola]WPB01778.1 hypothetical protein RHO25_006410 [Cercospora beticola]
MAVIDELPGVSISIQINGQALPEYRDDDIEDPERTISYMIEAMPNQIFEIHALASQQSCFAGSSLAVQFYVDGKYVDGALIDASDWSAKSGASARSRGKYVSSNMLRRYQFASREQQIEVVERKSASLSSRTRTSGMSSRTPLPSYRDISRRSAASTTGDSWVDVAPPKSSSATTTNSSTATASSARSSGNSATFSHASSTIGEILDAYAASPSATASDNSPPTTSAASNAESTTVGADTDNLEELGTIKIIVCHVNKKEPVLFGQRSSQTSQISDTKQKAIKDKAGGLLVRFTAPQLVSPVTTWDVDAAGGDENKAVTFVYHYRTLEMLDALGVLPKEDRLLPPEDARLEPVEEEVGEEMEGIQPHAGAEVRRQGLRSDAVAQDSRRTVSEVVFVPRAAGEDRSRDEVESGDDSESDDSEDDDAPK